MKVNKNHSKTTKSLFVCTSAILSLWLGSTTLNTKVQAAETDNSQAANTTVQLGSNNSTTAIDNQNNANEAKNQVLESKLANPSSVENDEQVQIQEKIKVVIHYQGDGDKWVPYVWGKKPNGNGAQYKWDGKDDYGYYANITIDENKQEVGVLIKGTDSRDKDGQGTNINDIKYYKIAKNRFVKVANAQLNIKVDF